MSVKVARVAKAQIKRNPKPDTENNKEIPAGTLPFTTDKIQYKLRTFNRAIEFTSQQSPILSITSYHSSIYDDYFYQKIRTKIRIHP